MPPLLATQLDASRVLGFVSFDCHPGSPFFSHRWRTLLLLVSVFSFWHHSLSLRRRPLMFRQQYSLSLLRRSLARSVCSNVPAGLSRSLPPAARTLRIALNFSPQKAGAAAGRPATCETAKGASGHRLRCPPCCRHGRDAASDPPPRPHSPRRKSSSRWKLIAPFYWNSSAVLILLCVISFFCVMNYAHLVYGMQMASVARAWMYRQPQEDW
jgi:hypothetical protein